MYEDTTLELARTLRELEDRVSAKIREEQKGELFYGLDVAATAAFGENGSNLRN